MQRPTKLSIRKCQQQDLLEEVLAQLDEGTDAAAVTFDQRVGTFRDRSVQWLVDTHIAVNKPDIIQSFERCRTEDGFNLSHESITSPAARQALRQIEITDPERWKKNIALRGEDCVRRSKRKNDEDVDPKDPDDDPFVDADDFADDATMAVDQLARAVAAKQRPREDEDPDVHSPAPAPISDQIIEELLKNPEAYGRGRRRL